MKKRLSLLYNIILQLFKYLKLQCKILFHINIRPIVTYNIKKYSKPKMRMTKPKPAQTPKPTHSGISSYSQAFTHSNPIGNTSPEQTYMNAFDLYIESVKIQYKGYFYIQWRRGKKVIQTLKHQSDGKNTVVKQTLTLNITLTLKNNRPVQKNTVLTIMNQQQQQIDQITLPVHKWISQYSSLQFPLAKGLIKAKVRRRQLMQVKSPISISFNSPKSYLNSDNQQYSEYVEEEINLRMMMSQTKPNRTCIDNHRDQTTKLRKQLQDTLYVNNKLKNDRSVLLTRNLQLQTQLTALKQQIEQQITRIKKHYKSKLQTYQQIYQDQINNMITVFNSNSEYNCKLLTSLITQNTKIGQENKSYRIQIDNMGKELSDYMTKISELELQKYQLVNNMEEYKNKSSKQQEQISIKNNTLSQQLQIIQQQLSQKQSKILSYEQKILEYSQQIKKYVKEIKQLEQKIQNEYIHISEHNSMVKKYDLVDRSLQQSIQQLEQNRNQLQFLQQAYKKQKQSNQLKEQTYRQHIKKLQDIIQQHEQKQSLYKQQHQSKSTKQEVLEKDNDHLRKQIMRLRGQMENGYKQIQNLKGVVEQKQIISTKILKQCQQQRNGLQQQINKLNQLINSTKNIQNQTTHQFQQHQNNSQLLHEKTRLLHQKTQLVQKLSQELNKTKEQFELHKKQYKQLSQGNNKLQQQLQFVKQNAIKIQEHQTLQNRVIQLENKLTEYQMHYNNMQFPSFQKEGINSNDNQSNSYEKNKNSPFLALRSNSQQEYQNISFQAKSKDQFSERIKNLQENLKKSNLKIQNLNEQNQELRSKINDLMLQLSERQLSFRQQLEQAKVTQMKIVQYCSSQEEQNRKLESARDIKSFSKPMSKKSFREDEIDENFIKINFVKAVDSPSSINRDISQSDGIEKYFSKQQGISKPGKLKKKTSMHIDNFKNKKDMQRNFSKSQILEQESANSQNEGNLLIAQHNHQKKQKLMTFRNIDKNQCLQVKMDKRNSRKSQQLHSKQKEDDHRLQKNEKVYQLPQSRRQKSSHSNNSNEHFHSGQNNFNDRQNQNCRQSIISGGTMYKFQRISHRQKIKHLQEQVQEYRSMLEQYKLQQQRLLNQIQKSNHKLLGIEKQLKLLEEDKHTLKASLHFQLQKNACPKQTRSTQTKADVSSFGISVNIPIEDPQKLTFKQQLTKSQKYSTEQKQQIYKLNTHLKELEHINKSTLQSLAQENRKYQQLMNNTSQLNSEIGQLKKLCKQLESKQNEYKNNLHENKVQKNQMLFNLERLESENKKYKIRIQQLQDKIKKNDNEAQLRQLMFESQNNNKKLLQQNRTIYQLKLQKDTIQDEMKLIRKRNAQQVKKCTQSEYSIQSLQKALEEYKRKQSRHRRELQDKEDNNQKLRDQLKRLNDQISTLRSLNNEQMFERKKYMDQITNTQNALQRKQYEVTNISKQLQKLRNKIQQRQQQKTAQKVAYTNTIQSLQSELSYKNKQIHELEASIRQTSNKLQLLSTQNKRNINQKSNTYSDKLKIYIEQIADIKRLLDDNNIQNNALKAKLREYEQQLQNTRVQSSRLEDRLTQQINNNKQISTILQNQYSNNQKYSQKISQQQAQIQSLKLFNRQLKTQLQHITKQAGIKKQHMQQTIKINEQLMQNANKFKIKQSQLQTQLQIAKNSVDKLADNQKYLKIVQKQFKQVKYKYEEHCSRYVHTPLQLQENARQVQNKMKQKYENIVTKIKNQLQNNSNMNKKNMENQIVQLLGQVSQLRTQSQKKSQFISELEYKISKMQVLPLKISQLQKIIEQKINEYNRYKTIQQNNRELRQKISTLQQNKTKIYRNKQQIGQQLQQYKKNMRMLQQRNNQFVANIQRLQLSNQQIAKQLGNLQNQQKVYKQEIQKLLGMNQGLQQQKVLLMQKSEQIRKQYNKKILKLEQKLQQMSVTVNEHENALSMHYERNMQQLRNQIQKYYQQLQSKNKMLQDSEEIINKLQYQIQSNKKQIQYLKQMQHHQADMFETQYNKIKNKLAENQKYYRNTINALQIELEQMSKEMTSLKLKKMSSSQFPIQRQEGGLNISRLEQKIKHKDTKLEQYRQNINILQETLIKYKKKQPQFNEALQRVSKLQKQNNQLQIQNKKLVEQITKLQNKHNNAIQMLKNQLNSHRNNNELIKISQEEKQMELQSTKYELQTIKQLYGELQKQLEKRKINLKQKIQNESKFSQEVNKKIERIGELEDKLEQMYRKQKLITQQLNKKTVLIQTLQTKANNYQKMQTKLKATSKMTTEGQHYKTEITRLSQQNQLQLKTIKKLREQLQFLQKDNNQAKTKLQLNQSSLDTLNTTLEEVSTKCRQLEQSYRKFQDINEACYKLFHVSLDEAIFHGYIMRIIEEKDREIQNLMQEVEELKFLNQRKLMDFEQIKKQNYSLQLKLDQVDIAQEQVQELREICDKLQQEKKDAVFRQEVLKVQMESLLGNSSNELKQRMEKLKIQQMLRRVTLSSNNGNLNRVTFG